MSSSTVTSEIFNDYLIGIESIRNIIKDLEKELNEIQKSFYKIESQLSLDEEQSKKYLNNIYECMEFSNEELHKISDNLSNSSIKKSLVIDGHLPLTFLINQLKKMNETQFKSEIDLLNAYLENSRLTVELFHVYISRFENDVLLKLVLIQESSDFRLKLDFLDASSDSDEDPLLKYINETEQLSKNLPDSIKRLRVILKSSATHIRQQMFDKSQVVDRILSGMDNTTQYPLIKLIPDVCVKLNNCLISANRWLDKEEHFIATMNDEIRKQKKLAKEKEYRILSAQNHQKNTMKIVKSYYLKVQNSKLKLREIAKEIRILEEQINQSQLEQQRLTEEKSKTQTMAEFLDVSISQTRMNYNLQMKQQRLQNQISLLETMLSEMEGELSVLEQEIHLKVNQKHKAHEKLQTEEKVFNDAKLELETYSESLTSYRFQLSRLRQLLSKIECFKTLSTSPEFVENIFGELFNDKISSDSIFDASSSAAGTTTVTPSDNMLVPSNTKAFIKISPSLQNSIQRRLKQQPSIN